MSYIESLPRDALVEYCKERQRVIESIREHEAARSWESNRLSMTLLAIRSTWSAFGDDAHDAKARWLLVVLMRDPCPSWAVELALLAFGAPERARRGRLGIAAAKRELDELWQSAGINEGAE